MREVPDKGLPEVGSFTLSLLGAGRNGRSRSSRFTVRCDALALAQNEILLLSVVGAETSVKAVTASLRTSRQDQRRVEYTARVGDLSHAALTRCPDGYRVYRTKLAYGLWHVLCGTSCAWPAVKASCPC
jgi:hypothetical protein